MPDLTTKQHWDRVWHRLPSGNARGQRSTVRRGLRRLLGPRVLALKDAYNNAQLWRGPYRVCLPSGPERTVIEIGSAPGLRLVEFHHKLGYAPFGVEYSEVGADVNRRVFQTNGLPAENVIHADFFDPAFQDAHRDRFDVVVSWSFLEHFSDPLTVVKQHANILKPGGILIVMVPNLRGAYGPLVRFFRPDWFAIHNLEIMDRHRFAEIFAESGLKPIFCGHHGLFSFQKLQAVPGSPKRHLLKMLFALQVPLNVFFNLVFRRGGPESAAFSQELLFIGRKPERS